MSTGVRRAELDGVRGVAVLLVLVGHADKALTPLAAAGVALFFTLSGYLITGLLLAERERRGSLDLRRFYGRRLTRLAPPLFVMLAVMGLLNSFTWELIAPATWSANYAQWLGVDIVPFNHTWSLAVEEQFYLVWPVLLPFLVRLSNPARTLAWVMAGLAAWWAILIFSGHADYAYMALETAGVPILGGCLVAMRSGGSQDRAWYPLAALLTVASIGVAVNGEVTWVFIPMLVAPLTIALVAAAGNGRWLRCRPLTACGRASYSLYLWHFPVAWYIADGPTPFGIAAGALVGLVAYGLVERPVLRWRQQASESVNSHSDVGHVLTTGPRTAQTQSAGSSNRSKR